ncbi:MAG TPA: hypothetical protein VL261_08165 [Nitrospira sp.]|jgi:hypothetical protein|nr:hypothetical protein [Nitrospira sp.]
MKVKVGPLGTSMLALGVGAIALMSVPITLAADAESKVEVTISDQGYNVKGQTTPGALTAIIVRNQGSMTHGISSPLFKAGVVKKEGDGVEIRGQKGKGFRAYHLEPGQTMTLYFSKPSTSDPATGISETSQVPFWCDIHTHMKGEFLVVETKGEIGGG